MTCRLSNRELCLDDGKMTQNRTMERIEAWLLLLFTMVYFLEGRFLIQLWVCTFRGRIPIGPEVASAFGNGPVVERIGGAFWWLAHALAGLFFVIGMEAQLKLQLNQPQGEKIAFAVILFGCTICCNIFIALVIKTISGSDSAVTTFWKWRLAVDAAVSASAMLVSEWLL